MDEKLSKLIVETFEGENPELCAAIKHAVEAKEKRENSILTPIFCNYCDRCVMQQTL